MEGAAKEAAEKVRSVTDFGERHLIRRIRVLGSAFHYATLG